MIVQHGARMPIIGRRAQNHEVLDYCHEVSVQSSRYVGRSEDMRNIPASPKATCDNFKER